MLVFIETRLFTRLVREYLSDDEFGELQAALIKAPNAGTIIPHSGGVRKLRWRGKGRGKRGGCRIIYLPRPEQCEIWLITIYPKNVSDTISTKDLKKIRDEIESG